MSSAAPLRSMDTQARRQRPGFHTGCAGYRRIAHIDEQCGRRYRVGEVGDVGLGQDHLPGGHIVAAHPSLPGWVCQRLPQGAVFRPVAVGRSWPAGEDHQHTIAVLIVGGDFQRLGVAIGLASPMMSTGLLWLQLREQLVVGLHGSGEGSLSSPPLVIRGRSPNARAAGVGQDGQPPAFRSRLLGKHVRM